MMEMIIIRMMLPLMIVYSHLLTMICAFSLSRMSPSQQQQTRQGRCRPSFFGLELCNASNGDHTENKSEDASLDRTTKFRNHLLREEEDDDDDEALQQQQQEQQQQLQNTFFALRHGQSDANVQGLIASNPRIACYRYGLSATGQEQAKQAGHDLIQLYLNTTTTNTNKNTTTANTDNTNSPVGIAIVSSDLLRAKETAQIVATTILEYNNNNECLDNSDDTNTNSDLEWKIPLYYDDESTSNNDNNNNNNNNNNSNSNSYSNNGSHINRYVSMDVRLRERNFGNWDGQSDRHYKDVWKEDQIDPYQTKQNVESVWMVTDRVTDCIVEWDRKLTPTLTSTTTTAATVAENKNRCWWIICVAHGDVLQILQTAFHNNMDPSEHRSVQHLETATLRRLRFQTNKME